MLLSRSSNPKGSSKNGNRRIKTLNNKLNGLSRAFDYDDYDMKPEQKRIGLIFNFSEFDSRGYQNLLLPRKGSEEDTKCLKAFLENKLKFEVKSFNNLKKKQVFEEIKNRP